MVLLMQWSILPLLHLLGVEPLDGRGGATSKVVSKSCDADPSVASDSSPKTGEQWLGNWQKYFFLLSRYIELPKC